MLENKIHPCYEYFPLFLWQQYCTVLLLSRGNSRSKLLPQQKVVPTEILTQYI
jgi:hypothetical protein